MAGTAVVSALIRRRWWRGTSLGVRWLISAAIGLAVASILAVGIWAQSPGSLAQVLGWAQASLPHAAGSPRPLDVTGVRGNLWQGGHIDRLTWTQNGLTVTLVNLRVQWRRQTWLQLLWDRSLQLDAVQVEQIQGGWTPDAAQPPTARRPPTHLEWPWLRQVDIPLAIDRIRWDGRDALSVQGLRGHYRYGDDANATGHMAPTHQLQLDAFDWAAGRYGMTLRVGATQALALAVDLHGTLDTPAGPSWPAQQADVRLTANGQLGTAEATLQVRGEIKPLGEASASTRWRPALTASVDLAPWSLHPVQHAALDHTDINLSQFWPGGPTTQLNGRWRWTPINAVKPNDGGVIEGTIDNLLPRPLNEQGIPLQRLDAKLTVRAGEWTVHQWVGRVGAGRVSMTGRLHRPSGVASDRVAWHQWMAEGQLDAVNVPLSSVWSTLPNAALQATAQAQYRDGVTQWQTALSSEGVLPTLKARGQWSSTELRVEALDATWRNARVDGQWRHTAAPGPLASAGRQIHGSLRVAAPGLTAQLDGGWPMTDRAPLVADIQMTQAAALQRWMHDASDSVREWLPASPWPERWDWLWHTEWSGRLSLQGTASGQRPTSTWPAQWQLSLNAPDFQWRWRDHDRPLDSVQWTASSARLMGTPTGWTAQLDVNTEVHRSGQAWTLQGASRASGPWPDTTAAAVFPIRWQTALLTVGRPASPRAWQLALSQPVEATVTRTGTVQVGPARWAIAPQPSSEPASTLDWEGIEWNGGWLTTRGRLGAWPLSWLRPPDLAANGSDDRTRWGISGLDGDVWLDTTWDVALPLRMTDGSAAVAAPAPAPRATVRVARQRGDLTYVSGSGADAVRLGSGLRTLWLTAQLAQDRLTVEAQLDTEQLGRAEGRWSTQVSPPTAGRSWHWAEQATLQGQASAQLPRLGLLAPWLPPGWRVDGTGAIDLQVSGPLRQPNWQGVLSLRELVARSVIDGIDMSGGELDARFDGDRVIIERLQVQGAGGTSGGRLSGQGEVSWVRQTDGVGRPALMLRLTADQWRVLARADRRLTLSGSLNVDTRPPEVVLTGQWLVNQALLLLPDEATPHLGRDVIVRGSSIPLPVTAQLPFQTRMAIDVDLGNRFDVRGLGVDTTLRGAVRLDVRPGQLTPQLTGDIQVARGTYRAYGQQLSIARGMVRFNGAPDNPSLDILAVRPHPSQTVGVEVTGTAQQPRATLFADPDMPDSEKLAWLVLGRPASGAGAEAAVLQQAALALFSTQGNNRSEPLAKTLGLDELTLQGEGVNADGTTTSAAVTLGKRLSDQLYVSYSRSVAGASGTVAIFLDLSRFLTLRAQAGDDNALDILFTRAFDHWRTPRTISAPAPP